MVFTREKQPERRQGWIARLFRRRREDGMPAATEQDLNGPILPYPKAAA